MKTHFSNDSSFFLFLNGWEKLVKTFLHIVMQEVTNNNRKKEFLLYCRLFQLQWKYVVFMCRIFVHYLSKIFVFAGTCNCILFPQKYNYFQNDDLIRKKNSWDYYLRCWPNPWGCQKTPRLGPRIQTLHFIGLVQFRTSPIKILQIISTTFTAEWERDW